MTKSYTRWTLAAIVSALMVLAPLGEARACWLFPCCGAPACPAPVSEAPVYTPAAPVATQVNYVPQTCYRTVYRPVAVTSYRPITTSDPCTGCPVTSLAPVTNYVQRPVVVPYTTYRPVVTNVLMPVAPACPCSSCGCATGGCATGACGVSQAAYYAPAPVAAAAPSCGCSAGAAVAPSLGPTTSYYAPSSSYYAPMTSYNGSTAAGYPPLVGGYAASGTTANYPPAATTYAPPATTTYYSAAPSTSAPGQQMPAQQMPTSTTALSPLITSYPTNMPLSTPITLPPAAPLNTYYAPSGANPLNIQPSAGSTLNYPMTATPGPAPTPAPAQNSPSNIAPTERPSLPADATETQKPVDSAVPTAPPKPIPDTSEPAKTKSSSMPRLLEPSGRTAAMPIMRGGSYTPVNWSHVTPASSNNNPTANKTSQQPIVDDDGWQAAK